MEKGIPSMVEKSYAKGPGNDGYTRKLGAVALSSLDGGRWRASLGRGWDRREIKPPS